MSTFTKFAEVSKCVSSSNLFFDLHPQQRDEIQVKVVVKDIDDNSPVFLQHNTTTGVRVNAPLYTVIDTLTAVDADVDSSAVFYQVWFLIKPKGWPRGVKDGYSSISGKFEMLSSRC